MDIYCVLSQPCCLGNLANTARRKRRSWNSSVEEITNRVRELKDGNVAEFQLRESKWPRRGEVSGSAFRRECRNGIYCAGDASSDQSPRRHCCWAYRPSQLGIFLDFKLTWIDHNVINVFADYPELFMYRDFWGCNCIPK